MSLQSNQPPPPCFATQYPQKIEDGVDPDDLASGFPTMALGETIYFVSHFSSESFKINLLRAIKEEEHDLQMSWERKVDGTWHMVFTAHSSSKLTLWFRSCQHPGGLEPHPGGLNRRGPCRCPLSPLMFGNLTLRSKGSFPPGLRMLLSYDHCHDDNLATRIPTRMSAKTEKGSRYLSNESLGLGTITIGFEDLLDNVGTVLDNETFERLHEAGTGTKTNELSDQLRPIIHVPFEIISGSQYHEWWTEVPNPVTPD